MDSERPSGRSTRRDLLKYTGAGLATTSLAGCMSYINEGKTQKATNPETGKSNFKGRTFKLGLLTAPPNTAFGKAMINSAKMAANEINQNGGIQGGKVEILPRNTQLQSARAKRNYRQLIRSDNVDATMGTLASTSLRAILRPMAEAERIHLTTAAADPMAAKLVSKTVSPIGGNPEKEYQKYKYHFRSGPLNMTVLANAFGEFLNLYADQFGWNRAAVLIENGAGAQETLRNVQNNAPQGLKIPYAKVTSASITNWSPIYDEIERKNVDVAFVVQLLSGQTSVVQWAAQERPFEFGGIHVRAQLPTFYKATGGAARSVWTMNAVTPQTTNTKHTQEFMNKYRQKFGTVPFFAGPITYDAVKQFATAVSRTGADPKTETDKLVNYMESPEFVFQDGTIIPAFGFKGPKKRFAHDPIYDCMTKCEGKLRDGNPHGPTGVPVYQQWQKGKNGGGVMEAFAPKSNKTAKYKKPPWMR